MIGMARVSGAALSRRTASQPSNTGKLISIKIRSGASDPAIDTPCSPSRAMATRYPRRSRRRDSMSRFISLSSTSRIFGIQNPPFESVAFQLSSRLRTSAEERLDFPHQALKVNGLQFEFVTPRGERPLSAFLLGIGSEDDDRDVFRFRLVLQTAGRLPAINPWKIEIHHDDVGLQCFRPFDAFRAVH